MIVICICNSVVHIHNDFVVLVFYGLNHYQMCNWRMNFQEGFARLWRGTNAALALAVPTVSPSITEVISVERWR
jgi:hypothetical protein